VVLLLLVAAESVISSQCIR